MKIKEIVKKTLTIAVCISMSCSSSLSAVDYTSTTSAQVASVEDLGYTTDNATFLTFSDDGITASGVESGYSIDGTSLSISSSGNYVLTGSCTSGDILVVKDSGEVNLILNGLDLTSTESGTCPIYAKGGSNIVNIIVVDGTENSLTDSDQGATSPKSCINASKDITISGSGTLNVTGNNKNGIKSDTNVNITDEVILNVTAVDNGIAADECLTVSGGTITVNAQGDAIRSCPDVLATDGSNGNVIIEEGSLTLVATQDAIQADYELIIYDGEFDITTNGGYTTTLADDADSCKGIKAGEKITIYDGTYSINTADDAIHSNGYVFLLGGEYTIYTGDDGAHADTSLFIGSENGGCPIINIVSSYEGLEGGTVYIYSGDVDVVSSDDGINAAGGSSNGTDTGTEGPGGSGFNPGGGSGTGPGGSNFSSISTVAEGTTTSDYSIEIYGGDIYVNADGDGVDSNGTINMTGGKLVVFGEAAGSDNSALDYETTCLVTGGILLACGSSSAPGSLVPSTGSQSYIAKTTTISQGKYIYVKDGSGNVVMSVYSPKQVNHEVYSPATSSYTITTASSDTTTCSHTNTTTLYASDASCESLGYTGDVYCSDCGTLVSAGEWIDATGHTWDEGTVTTEATETTEGVMTYTCTVCGQTYEETIPTTVEQKYTVTFVTDNGATIDVYYTQDYTAADETNVDTAYARDSSTGEIDVSGSGQVNFYVNVPDGYEISSVTAEGSYKNLKGSSDTGIENMYRLTKITGDVTVTVTCTESTTDDDDDSDEQYTVTFVTDNGATIDVYYTQDYTTADETNVDTAYARNSSTGEIDVSGSGQVNFYVNVPDGYEISSVTAEGSYNNLKGSSDTGIENMYRLTKITGDVTVTVTCAATTTDDDDDNNTFLKGDMNLDGKVNAEDAAIVLDRYKNDDATDDDYTRGDMNEDGRLNAEDAAMILDVYKNG